MLRSRGIQLTQVGTTRLPRFMPGRSMAGLPTPQLQAVKLPHIRNEPTLNFAPKSPERLALQAALRDLQSTLKSKGPFQVPCVVNGQAVTTSNVKTQVSPQDHATPIAAYHQADAATIDRAIQGALKAKPAWEAMPYADRLAIFLKAADLLSTKYRYPMMAATMLGQGKNAWQAEIDSHTELCDFWRFNAKFADEIYSNQPDAHGEGSWNRVEYRALEGFLVAYSPFNFTAIGGNLPSAPAIMGNVVLWKPSDSAIYSNWLVLQILKEAGLPDGVIQWLPADPVLMTKKTFSHPDFAGLHFTGSTGVFKSLWKQIADNMDTYKAYPRIVGETGGKNMHFVHPSADVQNAALHTIRAAFEYQGQKCSACSRLYVPQSRWEEFQSHLLAAHAKIKQGGVEDFTNFMGPVIHKGSFDKLKSYIDAVPNSNGQATILAGGRCDDSRGYFVEPTIILTKDPHYRTMTDELFGPVLTVYVYPDAEFEATLSLADKTSSYGLTGAIFAQDRQALITMNNALRNSAGNFYINDKCTGAVVGQQWFGGARASGTNDKAGSVLNLYRWVQPRTIKETFVPITSFTYPSNLAD